MSTPDIKALLERLEKLETQNELLLKVADKAKLQKFTPRDALGTTVTVSIYKKDLADEGRLVTSWKMIRDDVRVTKEKGVVEDQVVSITLKGAEEITHLKGVLERTVVPEKRAEQEAKIKELQKEFIIEMSLKDFMISPFIVQERVKLIGSETLNNETKVIFNFRGEDQRFSLSYINK